MPASPSPDPAAQAVDDWRQRGRMIAAGPDGEAVFVVEVPGPGTPDGPPLLVLHGFPSNCFDWRHVVGDLAAQRPVVLFDFLGFGLSDKPDRRYSIELHADTAEAVARDCGLQEVALLTHDMGDTVGGELLARDLEGALPFRVVERVLTNGSIYLDLAQLTPGQQMLWGLPDERIDLEQFGGDPGPGYRAGLASTFAAGHQPSAEELDAQWLLTGPDGFALLPRTIRYLDDRRAKERRYTGAIESHPSPLGIVWGDEDPVAVHAMSDRLLEARPDARRTTLEGVGHYPMIEDPAGFAGAVRSLLS